MEWSNELILEFLDLYQKEPVIWNPSHNLNKNRNDHHDAWKRIQEQLLDKTNMTCSITDLKKKKDSLMASYRTCLNKVKKGNETASGADEVYRPSWFAYDKMDSFLRERDQQKDTICTDDIILQPNVDNDNEIKTESDIIEEDELPRELLKNRNNVISKTPLEKKRKTDQDETLRQKVNAAFSILKTSTQKEYRKRDYCDIYGELLAAKLRKMDERTRDIAMNRIDNMLFEMKINQALIKVLHTPGTMVETNSNEILNK